MSNISAAEFKSKLSVMTPNDRKKNVEALDTDSLKEVYKELGCSVGLLDRVMSLKVLGGGTLVGAAAFSSWFTGPLAWGVGSVGVTMIGEGLANPSRGDREKTVLANINREFPAAHSESFGDAFWSGLSAGWHH